MVVFHKTSGNPQQIWHKEALQHDKPGLKRALVQRLFMGNKALPEENFMQQEAIFPALEVDLEPQGLTVRVGKGGVENFLSWPSSCRDGAVPCLRRY